MQKYEQARSLLSQRLRATTFEAVFEIMIDEFLERHSPGRKKARRDARKKQTNARADGERQRGASHAGPVADYPARARTAARAAGAPSAPPACEDTHQARSRHIPERVRDEVYTRDKGRCAYVGATGRRCGSKQALQIDHIEPFARGGPAIAANLRLLCAEHNRLAAGELFGETLMRKFHARE